MPNIQCLCINISVILRATSRSRDTWTDRPRTGSYMVCIKLSLRTDSGVEACICAGLHGLAAFDHFLWGFDQTEGLYQYLAGTRYCRFLVFLGLPCC